RAPPFLVGAATGRARACGLAARAQRAAARARGGGRPGDGSDGGRRRQRVHAREPALAARRGRSRQPRGRAFALAAAGAARGHCRRRRAARGSLAFAESVRRRRRDRDPGRPGGVLMDANLQRMYQLADARDWAIAAGTHVAWDSKARVVRLSGVRAPSWTEDVLDGAARRALPPGVRDRFGTHAWIERREEPEPTFRVVASGALDDEVEIVPPGTDEITDAVI